MLSIFSSPGAAEYEDYTDCPLQFTTDVQSPGG